MKVKFKIYRWLQYHTKSLSRHGVHSPFVYDFIENILHFKHQQNKLISEEYSTLINNDKLYILISQIKNYYSFNKISINSQSSQSNNDKTLYVFTEPHLFKPIKIKANELIVVLGINKTQKNYQTWKQISSNKEYLLGIDLYQLGILATNTNFKEKQYFILKY